MSRIIDRIEREAGIPGLASVLDRIPPTDLQSLLLEVSRRRCARRTPADLARDRRANRFVTAGAAPYRCLLEWERALLAAVPELTELVSLSPLCPLGTSSVLAGLDQNWVVSTVRSAEVVSDPTNVLALECAARRRASRDRPVHLATSQRVVRAQFVEGPERLAHFALFGACSAGRNPTGGSFELDTVASHATLYVRALHDFLGDVPLRMTVSDFGARPDRRRLEESVLEPMRAHEGLVAELDPERTAGAGYYTGVCFGVWGTTPSGKELHLVDGGAVDWGEKLLSDRRERMVISGIGSERVCTAFSAG